MSNESVRDRNPPAVTCPHCDAVLRNVTAEPGVGVRCLNCGKRFVLKNAQAGPHADNKAGGAPAAPFREEPRAPSRAEAAGRQPPSAAYWLLRISAALLLVAGLAAMPLLLQELARGFRWWRWLERLSACSYVPLIAWAGVILFALARALARIDSGTTCLAWRSGAAQQALPPAPGSSLPYIAPLAVAGGLLTMGCSAALSLAGERAPVGEALVGLLYGAAVFCCGFAMGDLRQFCWRQVCLAQACRKAAGGRAASANPPGVPSAIPMGCATAALAVLFVLIAFHEGLAPFGVSLWLAWLGYSLYRLCEDWDHAVMWWEQAAAAAEAAAKGMRSQEGAWWDQPPGVEEQRAKELRFQAHTKVPGRLSLLVLAATPIAVILWVMLARAVVWLAPMLLVGGGALWAMRYMTRDTFPRVSPAMRWFCVVPLAWMGYGAVWMTVLMLKQFGRHIDNEVTAVVLVCGAAGALAVWLAVFLAQVATWRAAQERYWRLRCPQEKAVPGTLPRLQSWLVWGVVVLACVQAGVFMLWRWGGLSGLYMSGGRVVEVAGVPLLVVAFHYPTIWVALLAREFLTVDAFYENRRKAMGDGEQ